MLVKKNKKSRKRLIVISVFVLIALLLGSAYFYTQINSKDRNKAQTTSSKDANRQNANDNGASQGGATDNNGKITTTTSQNQWKLSTSGDITLKYPASSSLLKSGSEINGSAKIDKVQYRLVDNSAGVIAQGELQVMNGNFSGVLNFKAKSNSGVLVIFNFDNQGREINRIEIPVAL